VNASGWNTRVGQADCRRAAGNSLALRTFKQFDDTCDHQHIDVASTNDPVR
jgi:hypothetical protein